MRAVAMMVVKSSEKVRNQGGRRLTWSTWLKKSSTKSPGGAVF